MYNSNIAFSLPISLTSTVLSLLNSNVSAPVSVQTVVGNYNTISLDEIYDIIIDPVKINPLAALENKIHSIKNLQVNWDGYGADVPDEKVIVNSLSFLNKLPEVIQTEVKPDKILPTPYGTIVFDIERDNSLISIEIGEHKIGFFSEFPDDENFSVDKTVYNENYLPSELLAAFKKLYFQNI
jgi:hypothetical protein